MEEKNKEKKKPETEEEMEKRLRAEIMAELTEKEQKQDKKEDKKEEIRKENKEEKKVVNTKIVEKETSPKKRKVSKEEKTVPEESVSRGSIILMLGSVVVIALVICCFPKIYQFILEKTTKPEVVDSPTNSNSNQEPVYEKITINSPVLEKFTYPIMRNSPYEKSNYYEKESLTMSDFSDNDILYNAFIYVHSGYISDYTGAYNGKHCENPNAKKMVKASYIDARIHNLFSKSTEYKHSDFRVPSTNTKTPYVGLWKYDSKNKVYVYYGDCTGVSQSSLQYYDLKNISSAEGNANNTVIEVVYHMGFAEVNTTNKQYSIYKDASMNTLLKSGTLVTGDFQKELDSIFEEYLKGSHQAQSYKYTFSSNDCSYQDYCFSKGEWVK